MDLNLVIAFVVGAAVAWALEWFLWDRPTRAAVSRRFEEELTLARNETEKIRVELRDSRDRSASLEREVGDVRAVLKAEADVRATAESKLLASDKKAVDLTAELARARSELQASTTRAAVIPTLEGSVAEWERKHQAEVAARTTGEQKAKERETRLTAQLSDWEARFKAESGARSGAEEKAAALGGELDALRAELAGATQKVALIPTLQTSATEWEGRYRQEVSAREQAEIKTGEVNAQLDKQRAQLGDWESRFKLEAQARATADAKASGLSLELDQLHGQMGALQLQQQDAFNAVDQQASMLSVEIDKLRAHLEASQTRVEVEAAERAQAETRVDTLTTELDTLRGELTTVHERVAVIPTLQASATDWEAKFQAEVAQRTRYQQEIQAYEEELARRGAQVGALETRQQEAAAARATAEQRIGELDAALTAAHAGATEGETRLADVTAARVAAEQRLAALEAERDALRQQLADRETRLSSEASARVAADQKANDLKTELDSLRVEVGSLSKRVTVIPTLESSATNWEQRYQNEAGLRTRLDTTVREREVELERLRERITALEAEHSSRTAALQSQLELFGTQTKADNLEDINGIGKVFARKLNASGVLTFEDLARTSIDRIREIIQPKTWQKIEPEAWVLEAAGRAGRPVGFTATPVSPDDLVIINGIGEVYARKLNEAGIMTFAQLAETSPERIREICEPEPWQKIEPEAWAAEAAERAQRGK